MPWDKNNFPNAMKYLHPQVRQKAIEIANVLVDQGREEGISIATAISRAKDWAVNHEVTEPERSNTDVKQHGADQYVVPHNNQWGVKSEGDNDPAYIFSTKKQAVEKARKIAKENNAGIIIQKADGKIQKKHSYNPHRHKM